MVLGFLRAVSETAAFCSWLRRRRGLVAAVLTAGEAALFLQGVAGGFNRVKTGRIALVGRWCGGRRREREGGVEEADLRLRMVWQACICVDSLVFSSSGAGRSTACDGKRETASKLQTNWPACRVHHARKGQGVNMHAASGSAKSGHKMDGIRETQKTIERSDAENDKIQSSNASISHPIPSISYPSIHPFTHPSIHPFTSHPSIHHSSIHPSHRPSFHLFLVHLIHPSLIHLSHHLFICSLLFHPFTHPIHPFHSSIHPSIILSFHRSLTHAFLRKLFATVRGIEFLSFVVWLVTLSLFACLFRSAPVFSPRKQSRAARTVE